MPKAVLHEEKSPPSIIQEQGQGLGSDKIEGSGGDGKSGEVEGMQLRSGSTKVCGCLRIPFVHIYLICFYRLKT